MVDYRSIDQNWDERKRLTASTRKPRTLHEEAERARGNSDDPLLDYVSAPESYTLLFQQYYPFVCGLVRKLGIDSHRTEDVASEILLRFYERDFLAKFDPDKVIEHSGVPRPARFKSFLSGFVAVYVQHHRDQQRTQAYREPLTCDRPIGEGTSTWLDVFGPAQEDDQSPVEEQELVGKIARHLATVPRRSPQDICDLPALFQCVVVQVRTVGKIEVKELQAVFGVSNTAIHSWLGILRAQVRLVVDAERARE